jgi:hypothetical protein
MAAQSASLAASNSGRSYMGRAAILIAKGDTTIAALGADHPSVDHPSGVVRADPIGLTP